MENIKGKNILVVDNNATCRRVFSEYLTSLGCRFDKADSGSLTKNSYILFSDRAGQL
jgi:CheY-like chemotaxis protein